MYIYGVWDIMDVVKLSRVIDQLRFWDDAHTNLRPPSRGSCAERSRGHPTVDECDAGRKSTIQWVCWMHSIWGNRLCNPIMF